MKPVATTLALAAADPNGVCLSQTPAAGGVQNLTIAGALASGGVATMDTPRHVSITSAGNDSARTFTVTGTDRYGNVITETISGPNATTRNGAKNFATVTAVTVDANTAGAIQVGSADAAEGPWIPVDHFNQDFNIGLFGKISGGASLTYGVETTISDIQAIGFQESDADAVAHPTFTAKTADFQDSQTVPIEAYRLAVSGHASGGVTLTGMQSGL